MGTALPKRLRTGSGKRPILLQWRSSAGFIVTMASFAVFTDVFLYAAIVPVVPFSLSGRAGVPHDRVQYWVSILLAVYGAAILVGSPIWGYVADRIQNRRMPMLIGLVLFAGATLFLCLSKNVAMLVVGRILQGVSAALTWTVGLALVIDTVDSKNIGQAMGWIGMGTSLGLLTSPLLGGVVYAKGGYYPVFAMCFGLIAVDIVMRLLIIEVKHARRWADAESATPSGVVKREPDDGPAAEHGVVGPSAESNEPSRLETDAAEETGPSPGTRSEPPVPEGEKALPENAAPVSASNSSSPKSTSSLATVLKLLRNPRLLAALWGTVMLAVFQTAFDSTLPLLVSSVFGWTSVGAGLIYLPVVLPSFLSPLIGMLSDKYGCKWFAAGGYLLATPFLICLRFVSENTLSHKVMLCGLLAAVGCCICGVFGPLMAEITWAVQSDHEQEEEKDESAMVPYATAYGLYNMAFSAGALLGPLMGGMIRDSAGWGTVGWVLGLLSFVTGVTQLIWVGGPLKLPKMLRRRRDDEGS